MMFRISRIALLACAAVAIATPSFAAKVAAVSVTASNTFPFFGEYKPENLINGSGLTGGLHDGNYAAMWMTDQSISSATLTFDLGAVQALSGINIWNYNFDTGGFYSALMRGAQNFTVSLSTDGVLYQNVLSSTLAKSLGGNIAAETFSISGPARYVKLDLLNNYAVEPYVGFTSVGLSEVNFISVPEPSSWALMISGFGIAGAAIRRRPASEPLANGG